MYSNNNDAVALNQEKDEENFQIEDLSSNHKWRTETPNIILDIGLNCYEGWLYVHIKRIASDGGKCTCSNKTLMEKTKMGLTKLNECKKSLQNKGLIKITERKKIDKSYNSSLIQVADMWDKNYEHFKKIKQEKEKGGVCRHTTGGMSPHDIPMSPHDIKEELIKEEQYNKKKEVASEDAPFLSNYFFKKLKEIRPKRPEPNWYSWNRDIDLLMRQKDLSRDDVIGLIDFVMDVNNTFVVESPASLKKKYERIADHIEIEKKRKSAQHIAKKDPRMAKTIEVINEYTSRVTAGTMGNDYSFIMKPDGGVYHTFEKRNYPRVFEKFMESLKDKGAPESMIIRINQRVNKINRS